MADLHRHSPVGLVPAGTRRAVLRRTVAKATRPADGLFLAMPINR
jgi:hypothetical protein